MKKIKIAAFIAAIAVMVLVVSLGMPWYTISVDSEERADQAQRTPLSLRPISENGLDLLFLENQTSTTTITSSLGIIGTGSSVLSLVFIGMAVNSDGDDNKGKIGAALLVVGFILMIVAPLFMMISYPDAYLDDVYDGDTDNLPEDQDTPADSFFGSEEENGDEMSWGPGMGWYLSFVGSILLLISLILVALGLKGDESRVRAPSAQQPGSRESFQEYEGRPPRKTEGPPSGTESSPQPDTRPQQSGYQEETQSRSQQSRPDQQEQKQSSQRTETSRQGQGVYQDQSSKTSQQVSQQTQQQAPQQTQQKNQCPDCGSPTRYINEYDRWYCDNCQEYK